MGYIYAIETPALLAGRRLSGEVGRDVGLLFVMWMFGNNSAVRKKDYLGQVLKSARAAKVLNPRLGIALATNLQPKDAALDIVQQIRPPTAAQRRRSTWFHRLRAIAESPFELTVAVDATVTVCSARLHAALQSEHRLNRFDFAVGFEATPLVPPAKPPPPIGRRLAGAEAAGRPSRAKAAGHPAGQAVRKLPGASQSRAYWPMPRQVEDMLPHNFAFAFRRGPGWSRLLASWSGRDGDDQQTLRRTLRCLQARCPEDRPFPLGAASWLQLARRVGRGGDHVRVMRLVGSLAGFKSLDKSARHWYPRYMWPMAGEALLLHSYEPKALAQPPKHASICAALNSGAPAWRMVAQRRGSTGYATHTDQRRCEREMNASVPARVCRLLAVTPRVTPELESNAIVAEPLADFWGWIKRSGFSRA